MSQHDPEDGKDGKRRYGAVALPLIILTGLLVLVLVGFLATR